MFYSDEGVGEVIIFVHGTPTSSNEYSEVIKILSKKCRCIALDHLGFGHSDKPYDGDYSLFAHQQRLAAFIRHMRLTSFHLLVHDFGGVIGLPLLKNLDIKIKSVTILNSWLWPLIETEPSLKTQAWLLSTGLLPFLYRQFNFSAQVLLKMAWGTRTPLTKNLHQAYMNAFPTRRDREGTVGFLKALFDFKNPAWQEAEVFKVLNQKQVQIIWGQADPLISTRTLERWKSWLPQAAIYTLVTTGHFVAGEAPEEVSQHLLQIIEPQI